MSKTYYECHVTIEALPSAREIVRRAVEDVGWKFSAIEGDIVLGGGVKYYATRHYNARLHANEVIRTLHDTADRIDLCSALKVVRRKVELVIFDDRSASVRPCDGGCYGCHLDDLKSE